MEEYEDDECTDVDWISPDLRDLGHGGPYHGTETVACYEEGQAECCGDGGDAEDLGDFLGAGGVDGGADVDGECEEADHACDEELLGCAPVEWVLRESVRYFGMF